MSAAAAPEFRPAVQVIYPGPLTTGMRQLEGVREATLAAAAELELDPGALYLAAVSIETNGEAAGLNGQVVYTFGVKG